jgi:outer membrane protein
MTRDRTGTRHRLTIIVALAGAAIGATGAVAQDPTPALTLEEAIQRSLEHSPQMAQAEGSVHAAEWGQRRASAAFFPTLSMSTGAGMSGSGAPGSGFSLPNGSTSESYSAGLSASMEIYSGGRRGADVNRARADAAAARASLTERQYAIVLSAQRSFFEVARAADLVEVARARVETAEQSLEAAQRRVQLETVTKSDELRAQLEHSRARQALLEAENQLRTASLNLGRLVGNDGPVDVTLTEAERTPRPLTVQATEVVELIVSAAPTVFTAEAALRSAEASTRAATSQYHPRVTLSSGYDWSSREASFGAGSTGWSMRLGVSLPLFDGFQRAAGVADSRVRAHTAAVQLSDARRSAEADAERLVGALQVAEDRIALAEEGVGVAEEDLRVQQTRYGVQMATMLDLLPSQTAVVEARQNLVAARYDYQIVRAELEALAGRGL